MKVSAIRNYVPNLKAEQVKNVAITAQKGAFNPKVISLSAYNASPISFTGAKNKEQTIFIGAESAPWSKAGGVGVVMKDYRDFGKSENQVEMIPYYGATNEKEHDPLPAKDKDGDYVMKVGNKDVKLELVSKKTMQWGKDNNNEIMLFRKKGDKDKLSYFVFVDSVSYMKKPYDNGFSYKSNSKSHTNGWDGDPYAKFSKACVELMSDVLSDKGNFEPATVVCSDAQTAYVTEYMAQKITKHADDDTFDGMKAIYIGHNMGPGYCGETSMQNMFVNLGATREQISKIEADPIYQDGTRGDEYFKPYVEKTIDELGCASAIMLPIHYAKTGFVNKIEVVAENYADSLATNPQASPNIHNHLKELHEKGSFSGIMNPLNDPSLDPSKPLPNVRYNEDCKDTDGKIYEKFEVYPKNPTYEEMRKVKNANKLRFLERLNGAHDTSIITGNPGKTATIYPEGVDPITGSKIRPDLLKKIKEGNGDEVPLFVCWGRSDTQKGNDIALKAFEKYAQTEEGKNSILVIGSPLNMKEEESQRLVKEIERISKENRNLDGRVIVIGGWSPGYAMASAADAAIFPSRFEPCGLTDLEAMKYYCVPIVPNTQGFAQKNFDPRNPEEAHKATSFKTKHEYNLMKSDVELIMDAYGNGNKEAVEKLKKEFPSFGTIDENGNKYYDETLFKDFARNYSEFLDNKKEEYGDQPLPPNWNDWDELSKDYNFRFDGFAKELKDGILVSEVAESLGAFATLDQSTKEKMYENIKNTKTGWETNGVLHPSGKSSKELYQEDFNLDYVAPEEKHILSVDDKTIDDNITEEQNKDFIKRIAGYSAAALTGGGALSILGGKIGQKHHNEEIRKLEEMNNRLKASIIELQHKNKKNIIVAAAIAAIGGALTTLIALTSINAAKNAKNSTGDIVTIAEPKPVQTPVTQSQAVPKSLGISPSLNEFQKKLV